MTRVWIRVALLVMAGCGGESGEVDALQPAPASLTAKAESATASLACDSTISALNGLIKQIQGASTARCVTVLAPAANASQVYQYSCQNTPGQNFKLTVQSDCSIEFRTSGRTDVCLDLGASAGQQVLQKVCNGSTSQRFVLQSGAQLDGISLKALNGICLEVIGNINQDGIAIYSNTCSSQGGQRFNLTGTSNPPPPPPPPPGSYLPTVSTPLYAYGIKKLVSTYTGPAVQLKRASDGQTADIGFQGNEFNVSSAQSFSGGREVLVTKIYCQDGVSQPLTSTPGHEPILKFDSATNVSVMMNQGPTGPRSLLLPTNFKPNRNNMSVFVSARFAGGRRANSVFEFTNGSQYESALFNVFSRFSLEHLSDQGERFPADTSRLLASASAGLSALVSTPAKTLIYRDNVSQELAAASAAPLSGGGRLFGSHDPLWYGRGDLFSFVIAAKGLSETESASVLSALQSIHHTNLFHPRAHVVIQGDSITEGVGASNNVTITRAIEQQLNDNSILIRNLGLSGDTMTNNVNFWSAIPIREPGVPNVLVVWLGTNDIALKNYPDLGSGAQVLWSRYGTYVAQARAAGFSKIIGVTALPRYDFVGNDREAERVQFNQLVRQNALGYFDAVWDADALTAPGQPLQNFVSDQTIAPDHLHPSEEGYRRLAPSLATKLRQVLGL